MNNVRGEGGVMYEGGDFWSRMHGLCRLAAHLYFMLPLRQMKPEPPGTRVGWGGGGL